MSIGIEVKLLGRLAGTLDNLEKIDHVMVINRKSVLLNLWIETMAVILDLDDGFDEKAQVGLAKIVHEFLPHWDEHRKQRAEENKL